MKKIVYLPLDERPCNYAFAGFLSEENPSFTLIRPDIGILGKKKIPADCEKINAFLAEECKDTDYLIVSTDMFLYGGIVPSRLHHLSEETLTKRLDVLKKAKEDNPSLKIYAFSLIMRCPSYSSADEEPDYYEECGREIFLYGQNEHKYSAGIIKKAEYEEKKKTLGAACGKYLDDYLARRKTNLALVKKCLALYEEKIIDKFVIPQDDSSPYGYTAIDQAEIKAIIKDKGLRVDIYPGADETGLTLLAAAVCDFEGISPKICPVYPNELCKKVIPLYEDRAVEESIRKQIENAGATFCESEASADILLFCNLPAGEMKNANDQCGEAYDLRNLPAFLEKIEAAKVRGKGFAVADLAYVNGGDREFCKMLSERVGLLNLWGYAGWNTSSNSLGTVICQSIFRKFFGDTKTHRKFTAERIYEDVGYCSYARKYLCDEYLPKIGCDYFHADGYTGKVSEKAKSVLEDFIGKNFPEISEKYQIGRCYMPWKRMFEVGLTVENRAKEQKQ